MAGSGDQADHSADAQQQAHAERDAYIAAGDQTIINYTFMGGPEQSLLRGPSASTADARRREPDGSPVGADALALPQRLPLEWTGEPVITVDRRVALWGATFSGKTCFIAALNAAVAGAMRSWTLVGADKVSSFRLSEMTNSLIRYREFPRGTSDENRYRWVLSTEVDVRIKRLWKTEIRRIPLRFQLDIMDARGGSFGPPTTGDRSGDRVIDHLLSCDGLIFLYDASVDYSEYSGSYEYFHYVMGALEQRFQLDRGFSGGRVPHRLAVCVSKFDDPRLLQIAEQGGHLIIDKRDGLGIPRVPDDRAALFFQELCKASPDGGAAIIDHSIRRYFRPDCVRYYASSAIGFYVGDGMRFDRNDCYNVSDDHRIRGEIRPVNVLEPLLWLYEPRIT